MAVAEAPGSGASPVDESPLVDRASVLVDDLEQLSVGQRALESLVGSRTLQRLPRLRMNEGRPTSFSRLHDIHDTVDCRRGATTSRLELHHSHERRASLRGQSVFRYPTTFNLLPRIGIPETQGEDA